MKGVLKRIEKLDFETLVADWSDVWEESVHDYHPTFSAFAVEIIGRYKSSEISNGQLHTASMAYSEWWAQRTQSPVRVQVSNLLNALELCAELPTDLASVLYVGRRIRVSESDFSTGEFTQLPAVIEFHAGDGSVWHEIALRFRWWPDDDGRQGVWVCERDDGERLRYGTMKITQNGPDLLEADTFAGFRLVVRRYKPDDALLVGLDRPVPPARIVEWVTFPLGFE